MLVLFPCVILVLTWLGVYLFNLLEYGALKEEFNFYPLHQSAIDFIKIAPWVVGICLIWFVIAYFSHSTIINKATSARPLERRNNKRIYNLVENVCIASGMQMPKVNIIEDNSLNAYAAESTRKITP